MPSSLSTLLHPLFSKSPKNLFFSSSASATATASAISNAITTATTGATITRDTTIGATSTGDTNTEGTVAGDVTRDVTGDITGETTTGTGTGSQYSGPAAIVEYVRQFKKKSKSRSFRSYVSHYDAVVRRLAARKHFSAIEDILEHQKMYKDTMAEEGFGVRLIMLYGKAGMFDHAYKVFDELPSFNCPRTVVSFNALLCACVNSKKFDRVEELFEELPEKLGIKPDIVSYNTVVKGFCEAMDFDSALKVMDKMEGSEVRPDVVSYNTVLEGYYKVNKMMTAQKLWRRMKEKGVVANVRTYNSMIRCLVKNGKVEEALEMVEKMAEEKVKPDKYTYKAVIEGCVAKGKLEEAKMLYGKMVGQGCRLSDHTFYGMFISFVCDKDDIDFALELCKHSIKVDVSIQESGMQRVVDALIKRSSIGEATELVKLVNSSKKHRYKLALPALPNTA